MSTTQSAITFLFQSALPVIKSALSFSKSHPCNCVRKYFFRWLPLCQSTLCLYVTYLARSLSFKSIKLYLCAVKQYALAHGYRDRLPNMHQLHFTLHGIKRKLGVMGHRKPCMPITIVLLKQIKSYIMSTYPNSIDQ